MVNMTLAVSKELKNQMDEFPEINWSEVARQAFKDKIKDMAFLKEFKENSNLTEDEALDLGRKVSKSLAERYSGS